MTDFDDLATLDPPGTIAVVGAGVLGIEAALYGRFLGYDVTLIEAESVGAQLREHPQAALPMLPDRCLSPLATSALEAQSQQAQSQQAQSQQTQSRVLPMTFQQWVEQALVPLTESDLLAGRLKMPARVIEINAIAVTPDGQADDVDPADEPQAADRVAEPIPADFRLRLSEGEPLDAEAVILAIGTGPTIPIDFAIPAPYFYQIGADIRGDAERDLRRGLSEIVQLFAELAGRADLDLYRPRRHSRDTL